MNANTSRADSVMNKKALRQFHNLPHVDDDMPRFETTADLVFQTRIQLDLIEEGDLEATAAERQKLERFVKRWSSLNCRDELERFAERLEADSDV